MRDSVQIRLWTTLENPIYSAANGIELNVPVTFGRRNLECALKEILGVEENSLGQDSLRFDFVVLSAPPTLDSTAKIVETGFLERGTLLRAPLGKFCERRGIPLESVLHIEYVLLPSELEQKVLLQSGSIEDDWIWSLACLRNLPQNPVTSIEVVAYYSLQGHGGALELDLCSGDVCNHLNFDGNMQNEQIRALAWCFDSSCKPDDLENKREAEFEQRRAVDTDATTKNTEETPYSKKRRMSTVSSENDRLFGSQIRQHALSKNSSKPGHASKLGVQSAKDSIRLEARGPKWSLLRQRACLMAGTHSGNIYVVSPCNEHIQYSRMTFSDAQLRDESVSAKGVSKAAIECIDVRADSRCFVVGNAYGNLFMVTWDPASISDRNHAEGHKANGSQTSPFMSSRLVANSVVDLHGHALGYPIRRAQWWSPVSAGAQYICSASWDGSVRLWDAERSVCTFETHLRGTRPNALAGRIAAFTESAPNDLVLVGCIDSSLRLIDPRGASSGKPLGATLYGAHGRMHVSDVCWIGRTSEQDQQLILNEWLATSVGYDGAVRIWDWRYVPSESKIQSRAASMIWERPDAHEGKPILTCRTTAKNAFLLTGGADGSIQQFSLSFK
jgi:WD40 repeat protein